MGEKRMILKNEKDLYHRFELFGAQFTVLLPREKAECIEVILEEWSPDAEGPLNSHAEMEQLYYIVEGQAQVVVGEEAGEVTAGDLVYIPRGAQHAIKNTGPGKLVYMCFDIFPEGFPAGEETWVGHEKVVFEKFGP
jgi:mannose-6-phosphate isomerase-like protein (cupin superfamily)